MIRMRALIALYSFICWRMIVSENRCPTFRDHASGRKRNSRRYRGVALRPLFGERASLDDVVDGLGDVGGVIAHPLDILGAEQKMRAEGDIARVFHHVGEEF